MNKLTTHNFEGMSLRSIEKEGEPWFVAKDVCDELDLGNVSKAVSRLDEDEKGITTSDTLGGPQRVSIINESGLYSLIMTSRKPEAKRFKKWVTSEVLPQIRKTGRYEREPLTQMEIVVIQVQAMVKLEREQKAQDERLSKLEAEALKIGDIKLPSSPPRGFSTIEKLGYLIPLSRAVLADICHCQNVPFVVFAAMQLVNGEIVNTNDTCKAYNKSIVTDLWHQVNKEKQQISACYFTHDFISSKFQVEGLIHDM